MEYLLLGVAVLAGLLLPLLHLSGYIFFEPYFVGHIPAGHELGLVLIVMLAALAAAVIPMNVYRIATFRRTNKKMGGGILGSIVGAAAGACSCGPVGFAIISTFGSAGAAASAFATNYEIPIRLISVAILAVTYYTTLRSLNAECNLRS